MSQGGPNLGLIIGIVVGCTVICLLGGTIMLLVRRKRKNRLDEKLKKMIPESKFISVNPSTIT